jgi:O-antigen/teichoic acid export membrane protein
VNQNGKILNLGRETFSLLLAEAQSLVLMVLFSIVLGRTLGEEVFGEFSLAFALALLLRTFVEAGFDMKIPREIGSGNFNFYNLILESQSIKNLFFFVFLIPFIIAGFTLLSTASFLMLFLWILAQSINSTYKSTLRGLSKFDEIVKIETLFNFILYSACFIALLTAPSLDIFFFLYWLAEITKTTVYYWHLTQKQGIYIPRSYLMFRTNLRLINHDLNLIRFFKEKIKENYALASVSIFTALQYRSIIIITGWLAITSEVGVYAAAMRFLTVLKIIPQVLMNVLIPKLAGENFRQAKNDVLTYGVFYFIIATGIASIFWLSSDFLIEVTFGFAEAASVLRILVLIFPINVVNMILESFLISKKHESAVNLSLITSIIVISVLGFIFISDGGATAAALAMLSGEIILFLIYIYFMITRKEMITKVQE